MEPKQQGPGKMSITPDVLPESPACLSSVSIPPWGLAHGTFLPQLVLSSLLWSPTLLWQSKPMATCFRSGAAGSQSELTLNKHQSLPVVGKLGQSALKSALQDGEDKEPDSESCFIFCLPVSCLVWGCFLGEGATHSNYIHLG